MTKEEIVNKTAEKLNLPKSQVNKMLEALVEVLRDALISGDRFVLKEIGSLSIVKTKSKRNWNPVTEKYIVTPASKKIKFRVSEKMRKKIKST